MLAEELIQKVRHIEFSVKKIVDDMMAGQYKSLFKGTGVQFSEHRQYYAGDDVRHIDWNVSARSKDLVTKKFEEERELSVLLVVDVSGSERFGSGKKLKAEILAEIGGMLAYAAIHTGDKVGALLFANGVEKIIRPKKGRQHILRLIREILAFEPKSQGTDLAGALESANRILKHKGVVFILSDFLAKDYQIALRKLSRKHDIVAIGLKDPREKQVPASGMLLLQDPETGASAYVDTQSYFFQQWLKDAGQEYTKIAHDSLRGKRIEYLTIETKDDYADALVRFFARRRLRR